MIYGKQTLSLKCIVKAIFIFYSNFNSNSDSNIYVFFNDYLNQISFML